MSKWLTIAAVALITVGAFAFREPKLTLRVFHQDEAIHCYRLEEIREEHVYKYIPSEYHGPTLNYFTFPVLWLTGANNWFAATEWHYRMVTVLFGTALVLSVLLLRDGVGNVATVFAALLTAVSPAMVFYSRYYIQEMLLVFFMAMAIGAAWRWSRSGRWGWLVILGAAIGFMHATKETFIINLFAAAAGMAGAWVMTRGVRPSGLLRPSTWLIPLYTAVIVSAILFSSFFHYWRGVLDSILTYKVYFSRGAGVNTDHVHPWWYYFQLFFWYQIGRAPVRTEMAIPALALVGFVYALWPRRHAQVPLPVGEARGEGSDQSPPTDTAARLFLLRWLAIYTLVLTAVYCRISYKTPWCALGFLHGMILLAGVGAAAIIRAGRLVPVQVCLAVILLLPVGYLPGKQRRYWQGYALAAQAYDLSYVRPHVANSDFNPYVYGHTSAKVLELVERVEEISRVWPAHDGISIQVTTNDCWPTPWYLRQYLNARFPGKRPFVSPELLIANADKNELPLPADLEDKYKADYFGLRRQELLVLYVRNDVWAKFIESRARPARR
ncbi:MAG: flippase activity-associated protein Agl23 [Tepidisphaeraceae bacterium]|jgi:uncharacterized protein (TIGR03663 family)